MKPSLLLKNSDFIFNLSQVDCKRTMARVPFPYGDPYFGGSFAAFGPQGNLQPQIAPQMMGMVPARVALPLDLAEDGPIYVNAKQYHGILRRRQSRAKLEAQNKLVKNRKPYLHESRHVHALKRVRGSGGRFLSTKKLQNSNSKHVSDTNSGSDSVNLYQKKDESEAERHYSRTGENASSIINCSNMTSASSHSINYGQPDRRFSGNSTNMGGVTQCGGGLTFGGIQQCTPVVR
ncbi:Nuclear transcription factor Y subunit A [Quillaja saponaria]|uniref:Nuclear transcription factor Y subunit n=1 Tax=Quillaja saponaria TaxID=32244 RepID=A0AAD7QD85_QUISA|nr:Nuclear transcription factor Y subunit A [Quillaja saponaria]